MIKAFFFGILCIPFSLCIAEIFLSIGLFTEEPATIFDSVMLSFFGAAIPEESAKLFLLWLLLRKNRYFDEKMDGIVYAVFVSLGFAAYENIIYLVSNYEDFIAVGISRALFAVPGHFCFGVIMGYYYFLYKFSTHNPDRNRILILVAPIIVHGLYDSILFIVAVMPVLSGILTIFFVYFCYKMWKHAQKNIEAHLKDDNRYQQIP